MGVPGPQFHEDIAVVTQLIPGHRTTECTAEQIVDVPGPQFQEDIAVVTAVRSVEAARSNTGSVKKWFSGKGFPFQHS